MLLFTQGHSLSTPRSMHAHTDQVAFTPRPPCPPTPRHGHLRIAALPPGRWRRASRPQWASAPRPPPFEYIRASMMQVTIRANHQNGRDSRVRQIRPLVPPAGAPGGWLGGGGGGRGDRSPGSAESCSHSAVRCGPRRRGAVRRAPVSRRQPAPARVAAGGVAGSEWRVGVAARARRRWGVVVAAGAAAVAVAAADGWVPR